jgi:hypothetical protein
MEALDKSKRARKPKAKAEAKRGNVPEGALEFDDDGKLIPPRITKQRRIFTIALLMAEGEWRPSLAKDLAGEWKLEPKTVQHYSAEAGRLVTYTADQRETLVKVARLRLRQIGLEDGPDRVQAWRTLLENLGELRQQHTVRHAPTDYDGWTQAEIEEYVLSGRYPDRLKGAKAPSPDGTGQP